jgi:hypothetical protein
MKPNMLLLNQDNMGDRKGETDLYLSHKIQALLPMKSNWLLPMKSDGSR